MKFLRQDYFKLKRLGKKWRRPKGMQSKMRKGKCGSGPRARIGYGSKRKFYSVVNNEKQLKSLKGPIIISSAVGPEKTLLIAKKAKELKIIVLNMKKIKRAEKIAKNIEKKRKEKAEKIKDKKKVESKKEKVKDKEKTKSKKKEEKKKADVSA